MDDKEDGELSGDNEDSFGLDYKPTLRPDASQYPPAPRPDASQYRPAPRHLPSSDEDCNSSDSDSDGPNFAKRKRPNNIRMDVSGPQMSIENGKMRSDADAPTEAMHTFVKPRKRNNVWASVMQEQVLNQEISGFGLKKRLDQGERSVESYDYREALKMRGLMPREEGEDDSDYEEDNDEMRAKRASRKRPLGDRLGPRKPKPDIDPVELDTLELDDSVPDQEYGEAIAKALLEEKPQLIIRVVETLGRKMAMDLYDKTKTIEQNGGLMILNGARRRTSGGVYLQLLKAEDVSPEEMQKIFPPEESENWRKRKRAHRKRERHESKPQGEVLDDGSGCVGLSGLFSDDPGGVKCPGSTPVTSPQNSDNEEQTSPINQLDDTDVIKVTSPPISSHASPVHPQSSVLDPRAIARAMEPRVSDPRAMDPRAMDPRAMDPRAMDPRAMDPRAMDPRAMDPRAMQQTKYEDEFLDVHADDMDMF